MLDRVMLIQIIILRAFMKKKKEKKKKKKKKKKNKKIISLVIGSCRSRPPYMNLANLN